MLSCSSQQGAKLRKNVGFPFRNSPLKIEFPKLFQTFRMEAENHDLAFYRVSGQKPLSKNWFSNRVFGCPGNPVILHPEPVDKGTKSYHFYILCIGVLGFEVCFEMERVAPRMK